MPAPLPTPAPTPTPTPRRRPSPIPRPKRPTSPPPVEPTPPPRSCLRIAPREPARPSAGPEGKAPEAPPRPSPPKPFAPGFFIYRRAAGGRFEAPLPGAAVPERAFVDPSPQPGRVLCYEVRAVASAEPLVESAPSNEACVDVKDVRAPAAPTGLTALLRDDGVEIRWSPSSEPDLAAYRVYRVRRGARTSRSPSVAVPETAFLDGSGSLGPDLPLRRDRPRPGRQREPCQRLPPRSAVPEGADRRYDAGSPRRPGRAERRDHAPLRVPLRGLRDGLREAGPAFREEVCLPRVRERSRWRGCSPPSP